MILLEGRSDYRLRIEFVVFPVYYVLRQSGKLKIIETKLDEDSLENYIRFHLNPTEISV